MVVQGEVLPEQQAVRLFVQRELRVVVGVDEDVASIRHAERQPATETPNVRPEYWLNRCRSFQRSRRHRSAARIAGSRPTRERRVASARGFPAAAQGGSVGTAQLVVQQLTWNPVHDRRNRRAG